MAASDTDRVLRDYLQGDRDALDRLDYLVRVFRRKADGEGVHAGELFKEHRLALHDGHRGGGADVAEAEDGRALRDDGDGVALDGQRESVLGVAVNLLADARDAGRVGHREVGARLQ